MCNVASGSHLLPASLLFHLVKVFQGSVLASQSFHSPFSSQCLSELSQSGLL